MSTLTFSQLEGLWNKEGGNPAGAATAAAIAEAESSGRADATSGNPDGGTNAGLWQLDTPGGKGAGYSVQQLMDPATNAKVAIAGSGDGTDWSAWQTYAQGTYRQFLNGAAPSSPPGSPGGSGGSGGSGGGAFSNIKWYEPWTWANAPGDAASQVAGSVEQWGVHYGAIAAAVVVGAALAFAGIKRVTGIHPANPVTTIQQAAAPAAAAAVL